MIDNTDDEEGNTSEDSNYKRGKLTARRRGKRARIGADSKVHIFFQHFVSHMKRDDNITHFIRITVLILQGWRPCRVHCASPN